MVTRVLDGDISTDFEQKCVWLYVQITQQRLKRTIQKTIRSTKYCTK